jgi:hypothetical protein
MSNKRSLEDISIVYESKVNQATFERETSKTTGKESSKKSPFVGKKTGPESAEGFKKDIIAPAEKTKAKIKDNFYKPEKFSQNVEKTEVKGINNFMNKSIFDKLYEDVMADQHGDVEASDAEALGLPSPETSGEETEKSTKELVADAIAALQKLHDSLPDEGGAGEEEKPEEGSSEELAGSEDAEKEDEGSDEDEKEDKEEETQKEATEMKELPDSAGQSLQKKDNKVGDATKSLASKGTADAKVTDKVGNDGDKGHALVGSGVKGGAPTSPKGKANVVASNTSKVGAYLAGLK